MDPLGEVLGALTAGAKAMAGGRRTIPKRSNGMRVLVESGLIYFDLVLEAPGICGLPVDFRRREGEEVKCNGSDCS